jgi:hypothetical protein
MKNAIRIVVGKTIACITIVAFIMAGCVTYKPVEISQPEVQERISLGELIHPGDKVRITNAENQQFEFEVISVEGGYIKGKDVEIAEKDIAKIAKLEKSKTSLGKTALTVVLAPVVATWYVIYNVLGIFFPHK